MAETLHREAPTSESISARIERLPFTPFHRRALSMVGLAHFFDAFDALAIAFVLPVLITAWGMSPADAGLVIAIGYAGQTIGSIGMGWAAERWGRLRMVTAAVWILSVMSLASAAAWNVSSFMTMRFVQGIGLGGESPTAATYINEICPARLRGRLVFVIQALFALATAVTALVAIWMIPRLGWQSMYIVGGLPVLLAMVLRRVLPESPRWLASRGRIDEADRIVTAIEDEHVARRRQSLPVPVPVVAPITGAEAGRGLKALMAPQFVSRTLSVWLMAFCISITGYGILAWMPTLYRTVFKLPMQQALTYGAVSNVMSLLGAVTGLLLIDYLGRRKLFLLAFVGGALPLIGLWHFAAGLVALDVVKYSAVSIYFISILLPGIYVYAPEIYPTRIRGVGAGFASAWLRIASIVGPVIVGILLRDAGVGSVFLFLGTAALVGAATVFFFAIETRGRPLDEIAR